VPSTTTGQAALYRDLNDAQADGLACIVDGVDFATAGIPSVPVGRSEKTRSQVFACAEPCASHLVVHDSGGTS
jgi:hypothetical protein